MALYHRLFRLTQQILQEYLFRCAYPARCRPLPYRLILREYACHVYRQLKHLCLGDRIFVRLWRRAPSTLHEGSRDSLRNNTPDLTEFVHEIFMGMKAPGVYNYYVDTPCYRLLLHPRQLLQVRPGLMLYDLSANTLTKYPSWSTAAALKVSPAATSTLIAVFDKNVCKFCYGCGLPTPFTPTTMITVGGLGAY